VSPNSVVSVTRMSTRARFDSAGGGTGLFFLAMTVMLPHLACAESGATGAASPCRPATLASGMVGSIIDGRTFVLDDGREVRLAGIEIPAAAAAAAQASERLHALLSGQAVVLKGSGPDRDRYGRLVAQVFLAGTGTGSERTGSERWVQPELVASGHARVAARVGDRACAAELARHERAARQAKLGLWSDPYYVMRRAEDPAAVAAERGRFTIVEGTVLSVRESGGTIYVNFGKRWSEDFTVTIAKRNERAFAAAGIEPKALAGRRVRVRGWIEERGGPWVEATRPEQIELVERN
jgi:endonuclease YncB( thermonuclease family)